jgi:plastocyanin
MHRSTWMRLLVVAVAAAATLAGCGGADESPAAAPAAVTISEFKYDPTPLTVRAGTTVKVANRDRAPHTLTAARVGAFDSGTIAPAASGSVRFTEPGTFAYLCQFHPFMKGSVTVTA